MRLPINPKPMYPIPAPMFALSLKFAHNSWHSQYKSIVAKFSPSLPFAPFVFSPPTLALPKMFQVQVYKCLGHVMRDSWYGKWCAPLALVTWEVMGVKNDKMKNAVPMGVPGQTRGRGEKICSSTRVLTDRGGAPPPPHKK